MAYRNDDQRHYYKSSERRHGSFADPAPGFSPAVRPRLGENSRGLPTRNSKYVETDYPSREIQGNRGAERNERSAYADTVFPVSSASSDRPYQLSGEESLYRLNSLRGASMDDVDQFLYGSESSKTSFSKDYLHGKKPPSNRNSVDDDDNARKVSKSQDENVPDSNSYDSTIENILKSIGFNVDLAQIASETAKSEQAVENSQGMASQIKESYAVATTDVSTTSGRLGSAKKIDSILPSHESYEERARRYREEQTRLYAEANGSSSSLTTDVTSQLTSRAVSQDPGQQIPVTSLELLQHSYDYEKLVNEVYGGVAREKIEKKDLDYERGETPKKANRQLYEDFSDSDDNLDDLEKADQRASRKTVGDSDTSKTSKRSDKRSRSEREKERKTITLDQRLSKSEMERSLAAEKPVSSGGRERDSPETTRRQVKIVSGGTASEAAGSSRRNSGGGAPRVTSRWDSPERVGHRMSEGQDRKAVGGEKQPHSVVDSKMSEKRKAKINNLNQELETLRQEQKDLMRRKQRGRYGHKDPELVELNRRLEKITTDVDKLTKCTEEEFVQMETGHVKPSSKERNSAATSTSGKKPADNSSGNEKNAATSDTTEKEKPKLPKIVVKYDFFDDGNHWCRSCNCIYETIDDLCEHLHSSSHTQKMDMNHRPWSLEQSKVKQGPKSIRGVPFPIRGVEFLMPTNAYYCSLCKSFAGDGSCAFEHLKSNEHNENYQRFIENDMMYEHHYNLDKTAALSWIKLKGTNLGDSTKRSSTTHSPEDPEAKRLKLTSDGGALPLSESNSDKSQSGKTIVSKIAAVKSNETVPASRKPSFIGKLPCLKAPGGRKGLRGVASTKVAARGDDENKDEDHALETEQNIPLSVPFENLPTHIPTKQTAVEFPGYSTAEQSAAESTWSANFPSYYDGVSTRPVIGCSAFNSDSFHGDHVDSTLSYRTVDASQDAVSSQPEASTDLCDMELASDSSPERDEGNPIETENPRLPQMEEMMSLGDFEVFDECDAE